MPIFNTSIFGFRTELYSNYIVYKKPLSKTISIPYHKVISVKFGALGLPLFMVQTDRKKYKLLVRLRDKKQIMTDIKRTIFEQDKDLIDPNNFVLYAGEFSDDRLTHAADSGWGDGPGLEMMRRLKNSTNRLEKTTSLYSRWLIILTVVLILLTVFLVYGELI